MSAPPRLTSSNVASACKAYFSTIPKVEGNSIDASKLSPSQITQIQDLIKQCNQADPSSKDKYVSSWKQVLGGMVQAHHQLFGPSADAARKAQSAVNQQFGDASTALTLAKSYAESLPKKLNEQGILSVDINFLSEPQIQELQSILQTIKQVPSLQKTDHLKAWEGTFESMVQAWTTLYKSAPQPASSATNPASAAAQTGKPQSTSAPSASSPAKVALTPERFAKESEALQNHFDLAKAQILLKEIEASPQTENTKIWKNWILFLIEANTVNQPTGSNSPAAIEFAKMQREYRNSYEAPLPPVGIRNEGNTCFAAALMQVVSMNTVLSAAYRDLLPNGHYAKNALASYRTAQTEQHRTRRSQVVQEIVKMRAAFGNLKSTQQQDASELSQKITDNMRLPADGMVATENNGRAQFGLFLQQFVHGDAQAGLDPWRPYSVVPNSIVSYPTLDLQLPANKEVSTLNELIALNLGEQAIYFSQNPNVMLFNFGRLDNVPLNKQKVDLPLYYEIPAARKKPGLEKTVYTLQGFLSHSGTKSGGHYIAYHQWNGKFYKADDSIITEVSLANYLEAAQTSYLPVYAKLTPR